MLNDVKVHFVQTIDEASEFARWFSARNRIAFDTETTGLDPIKDDIRLIQIADANTAWVLPIESPRSWGGLALDILENFKGKVVGHNTKFDDNFLCEFGIEIDWSQYECTMLMSRVLEPMHSAALKTLASRYVDHRAGVMQQELNEAMKGGGHDWATVPLTFEPYWFYGGIDAIITHRLADEIEPKVKAIAPEAYKLELVTSLVCGRMERKGVKIDIPYTQEATSKINSYVEQITEWCTKTYGVKPGSNDKIVEILQNEGYFFDKLTNTNRIALDKEVLASIDHPLAQSILSRRQAMKTVSSYLRHFLNNVDGDERIHPSINSCNAKTSRMSMNNPNLQNLPRKGTNKFGDVVRGCISADPGNTLLMVDFNQIEWRLFAAVANDQALADAFQADDFFTEMCRQVFNDPTIQRNDPRRQIVKNAMYARIYGAGTKKFAWTAGITVAEAEEFNALLDFNYPAIRQLQQRIDRAAMGRKESEGVAYVQSPLTNRRFMIDDDSTYKLVNYLFQGTAAEVLKMKLIELSMAGFGKYMVTPVHDEIIMEVPDDDLEEITREVLAIMNDDTMFKVPITADASIGPRWSEKLDYQPA